MSSTMKHLEDIRKAVTYDRFTKHFSLQARESRLTFVSILREQFPDQHVTVVDEEQYDIDGFCRDGHAALIAEPGTDEHDTLWDARRLYITPERRFERDQGKLEDKVIFGRFNMQYREDTFVVYRTCWFDDHKWSDTGYWYILSPKATAKDAHHHPTSDALLLAIARWTSELHDEIYVFDNSEWTKSKSLWKSVKGSSWDDVIMDPKAKQSLIDDVQGFFDSQALYNKFRVPWKRGIILHGVPGNGKTCSIKALMNYLGELPEPIPSMYVKTLDNKCNMPQWSVKSIFTKAREMSPCLLIFEDLDSLISEKVRSYFLNEVDGLESNDGILMIGSTNHLNRLDPAISKRPSRFDRKYHFRIPDLAQRELYAEYWRSKLEGTDIDFPQELSPLIAQLTETFSFAYLKELFVVSLLVVARGSKGDDDASDWEEVSETQSPPEAAGEQFDGSKNESEKIDAAVDCAHCKHIKAEDDKCASKDRKATKKPLKVPKIDIPEAQKDNVLLKVIQQQIKMLLHEMDNTDEEEKLKGIMDGENLPAPRPSRCD